MKTKRVLALISIALLAPALAGAVFSSEESNYKIQTGDVLNVTVFKQPDLTTKTRVTSDGFMTFPLLGKVDVRGTSAEELERTLKQSLEKDYLVSAQVTVFIEQYHSRQVSVLGEVMKPGKFDMPTEKKLTVMESIALAGGFTRDASPNATTILRTNAAGKQEAINVKVKEITQKGKRDDDIALEPGDVVNVPEGFI